MRDRMKPGFVMMFLFVFALIFTARPVHGAEPLKLSENNDEYPSGQELNLTYDYYNLEDSSTWLWHKDYSDKIADAVSSDEKVATASFDAVHVTVTPRGEGSCTITVTGAEKSVFTIKVNVKKGWQADKDKKELKLHTNLENYWYGSKKLIITSIPGASGTLKVGKGKGAKTYKIKLKASSDPYMQKTIKLSKIWKLNTPIKLSLSSGQAKKSFSYKFISITELDMAKASGKKLTLTIYNPHKGDKVMVIWKGKTYTKTISKDNDNKSCKVVLNTRKKFTKNSSFYIKIQNKDKAVLQKKTKITLSDWRYELPDEDEYSGSEDEDSSDA